MTYRRTRGGGGGGGALLRRAPRRRRAATVARRVVPERKTRDEGENTRTQSGRRKGATRGPHFLLFILCLVCGFILLDESQYEDDFRPSPGDARARVTPMRLSVVSGLSHSRFLRKVFSPPLRSPLARAVLHPPHRTSTRTQKYSARTLLFSSNPQTPRTLVTTLVRVLLCTRLQKVLPSS